MAQGTDERGTPADHAPDNPFGCTVMWGPPVVLVDMGLHVCNEQVAHTTHLCKCGAFLSTSRERET